MSDLCSNESEQNQTFKIDLTDPFITNLVPANNSLIDNAKPIISALIDDVYQSNSGIDESSVHMDLDGVPVNIHVDDISDIKVNITHYPPSDLSVGIHNITVYASDNAGRHSLLSWSFEVTAASVFNMSVDSPQNITYNNKRVPFIVKTTDKVSRMEFMNYDASRLSWKVLCKNCDMYGYPRTKTQQLLEGSNNITIRATDYSGNTKEENILLFVDSKSPRIITTSPRKNSVVNGSLFSIQYTEENLEGITLFFGNEFGGYDNKSMTCEAGIRKECIASADLSRFNGTVIDYYFQITDVIRSAESRKTGIKVDVTPPELTVNFPVDDAVYTRAVPFNITVSEPVRLQYYDQSVGSRWSMLCSRCDDFGNLKPKTKSFKRGPHNIIIKALDNAGHESIKELKFVVT